MRCRIVAGVLEIGFGTEVRQFEVLWKGDSQPSWLEESELSNCRDLLKEYCNAHGLPFGKQKNPKKRVPKKSV